MAYFFASFKTIKPRLTRLFDSVARLEELPTTLVHASILSSVQHRQKRTFNLKVPVVGEETIEILAPSSSTEYFCV